MKFCEDCGNYLQKKDEGFWCQKCGKKVKLKHVSKPNISRSREPEAIHFVDKSKVALAKISRRCSECGNGEAYTWLSTVSGEHAGVRRERTVKHFRCVKCSHSWTENY